MGSALSLAMRASTRTGGKRSTSHGGRGRPDGAVQLGPYAEHLGHAPCLGDAPAGGVGTLGVEHLADRPDARLVQMLDEPVERAPRLVDAVRIHLQPAVDVRAHEPAPYRALMVGGVARAEVAEVPRL